MRTDEQKPDRRRERRTSRPLTAKSIAIKGAERTSGGGASKAVELTLGDLRRGPQGLEGSARGPDAAQKSAEAIVGGEEAPRCCGGEKGEVLTLPKGRTVPIKGLNEGAKRPAVS